MTTIIPVERRCANCGAQSQQVMVGSTNTFGSADLDTRPPEMMRSTIAYWVERCPSCGYCAGNLEQSAPAMREVIEDPAYQNQLGDPSLPELAASFLCWSMIQAHARQFTRAGWNCLHAAWVCDDDGNTSASRVCRARAIDLLQRARQVGQRIAAQPGAGEAVLIDLLRRTSQFELALSLCEDGLRQFQDEPLNGVLRFQRLLIGQRDTGCYTVDQALGNA